MSEISGGELVARTLVDLGVTTVFGVHGGHLDSFLSALQNHGVRMIDCRHEGAAGNAAEGHARATGGLGVVFATSGPGFTNVYAALANAKIDRIPMLLITSSPPLREVELNVLQGGLDQVAAANTVTKWAYRATTVARLPDLTALAVRHALTGVPGPTMLEVPIDVMFKKVDESIATRPHLELAAPPAPAPQAMDRVVELLSSAERPVIVLGGGASMSHGARPALEALLDAAPMPAAATSWGYGVLDPEHPYWVGGAADLAALPFLGGVPDVFLLVGARRGISLGAREDHPMSPEASVVHVDIDGVEPGRIGRVDIGLVSDVTAFLEALTARADELPGWADWARTASGVRGAHAMLYADAPELTESGRMHPYFAARAIIGQLEHDDVVVYDGGETAAWMSMFARASTPRSWFGLGSMGGLGVGQGFAMGAQAARPDAGVILVTGDGAVGFHLQEFDTMMRHGLPVITIVMNNQGWGMSFHGQDLLFGPDRRVVSDLPDTRYDVIAQSMGLYGERVTRVEEIAPAIARARASGLPACLDLAIGAEIVHPIMDPLAADIPEGATRIPYYEPIPAGEL